MSVTIKPGDICMVRGGLYGEAVGIHPHEDYGTVVDVVSFAGGRGTFSGSCVTLADPYAISRSVRAHRLHGYLADADELAALAAELHDRQ